jgi:hypothetical protein
MMLAFLKSLDKTFNSISIRTVVIPYDRHCHAGTIYPNALAADA